ncbi:hypothetical protein GALMADRAFT_1364675 [Galerina marginata CBS 339.88]|uniref:ABC transporter domain-containing protein n=1 Tax=Galerina marginata (strain CBS 339.88) TaxID=685588 RepID=A0A067T5R5_GALM3|nr:hypothetical protein GALMADRAFT_1364675 [Galerina marginata CBS 339.88]
MTLRTRHFPANSDRPLRNTSPERASPTEPPTIYGAWLASREIPEENGTYLVPGATRSLTMKNLHLAIYVTRTCTYDLLKILWGLNPFRTTVMMLMNIVRSLLPALRGYSQAMIIDELQVLVVSGNFTWCRILYLISTEALRRVIEGWLDTFAASNENLVFCSAQSFIEYKQMEQRLRLDVPSLADPTVRALLQESDLFVRSFGGSGAFGFLSPLDVIHIFSLLTEIISHFFVIASLTRGAFHVGILVLSIVSIVLPLFLSWLSAPRDSNEPVVSECEARISNRQEWLRNLAYSDAYRPEIELFGLSDWILESWSRARKTIIFLQRSSNAQNHSVIDQFELRNLVHVLQNIPLLLLFPSSSATLGSSTAYHNSIQSLVYAFRNLLTTTRMIFQGVFLMSAFTAGMTLKPMLNPEREDLVDYTSIHGGASIRASGLSYTYPGCSEPALKNVTFSLEAGQTLAVVGYNGSGKSTLARILLRIDDFDQGTLLVNEVDIRRYNPAVYHSHLSAVFQGFSKFGTTVIENVGLGSIEKLGSRLAIKTAIRFAEAEALIESLPNGLKTMLETSEFESMSYSGTMNCGTSQRHGLSGGEWQRIALARAFMRANEPGVNLLLFDEPSSALDARAQKQIFDSLEKVSRSPSGERQKTVIFITHRLSTARRADKIAVMDNGTISEFGSHDELMEKNGLYASLYRASV